ncbi:ionotropic receptor 75a-like [Anopheles bellator]|uniref:ionotropic receptor 75a-like n=1 Tax=Anopheles bellator TaxID=139047 RepID=UPI002649F841|nr:ionotropic receptor 75a-like [Anopheles bellator]
MLIEIWVKLILAAQWRLDLIGTNSSLGVVGQMQMKVVDFSVAPLAVVQERVSSYDGTIEIGNGKFFSLFRHPKGGMNRNIFLHPFQSTLWVSVGGLLIFVAVLLCATLVIRRTNQGFPFSDIALVVLDLVGLVSQQGFLAESSLFSKKLIFMVSIAFCVLLMQFYSTFIMSYQLVRPPKTINTIDQLIASPLKVLVENMSYNMDFFKRTKDPAVTRLYQRSVVPYDDVFYNVSTGIELVKKGGYSFQCETSYAYAWVIDTFTEQQICELHYITVFPHRAIHIPVVKGSPLRELFRVNLQRMKETAILAYDRAPYFIPKPKCVQKNNETTAIKMSDVITAFLLLVCGILLSCFFLLLEIIFENLWLRFVIQPNYVWID